ncbi:hypothetical protein BGX26_010416, partial [Mortierella sp. AD094]
MQLSRKNELKFNDVAAHELDLWHVSIPTGDNDDNKLLLDEQNDKKLNPTSKISKMFGTSPPPEETVHIIAQCPSRPSKAMDHEDEALLEQVRTLQLSDSNEARKSTRRCQGCSTTKNNARCKRDGVNEMSGAAGVEYYCYQHDP